MNPSKNGIVVEDPDPSVGVANRRDIRHLFMRGRGQRRLVCRTEFKFAYSTSTILPGSFEEKVSQVRAAVHSSDGGAADRHYVRRNAGSLSA